MNIRLTFRYQSGRRNQAEVAPELKPPIDTLNENAAEGFPQPRRILRFLPNQIRIGISTYRDLYSASGSSGRICPADCESLNSSRTSPSFPSAFKKSMM